MTARAGYHVRMLTYSETKTVHGSVLDWTLLRMRDLFKSILVDAHAANIHSKFAFMWFLMFPEKNHIKTLLSHISIILTITTIATIARFHILSIVSPVTFYQQNG
jgi:hypothetical protein